MSTQMELPLVQRRTQCRQRPVVERLLEIIRRQGVGTGRNEYKGRVMFRPELQRPVGLYMDLCSGWECMNRFNGFFTAGYGNRAEAKRLSSATHSHHDQAVIARLMLDRRHVVDGDLSKVFRRHADGRH